MLIKKAARESLMSIIEKGLNQIINDKAAKDEIKAAIKEFRVDFKEASTGGGFYTRLEVISRLYDVIFPLMGFDTGHSFDIHEGGLYPLAYECADLLLTELGYDDISKIPIKQIIEQENAINDDEDEGAGARPYPRYEEDDYGRFGFQTRHQGSLFGRDVPSRSAESQDPRLKRVLGG